MAKRRMTTDYSFAVGVDKPAGMTSHDVVARCRRVYGERRIGHTGTLDPAASGVLVVCVGPATRLARFLTGHGKTYEFAIVFGTATDTDDAEGAVIHSAAVPEKAGDPAFARRAVEGLVGKHMQLPPVYSAIKVNGTKSYAAARAGNVIELEPRPIEIYSAELISCESDRGSTVWTVRAHVSAGTYVRSIARDCGRALGTVAHVGSLRRIQAGSVRLADCVTLEALESDPFGSLLDPVVLLGMRFVFADRGQADDVSHGRPLKLADEDLFAYGTRGGLAGCGCTDGARNAPGPLSDGERIAVVNGSELMAVYEFTGGALRSVCGFSRGVKRGSDI